MAHHNKFLSVNLNNSYGKPSSSSSLTSGYGNVRARSAGGAGGMVVLSRPRSSSGASAHKNSSRLAVPPPVNLPSLRKEHERLDPASSKPSSGHSGSGLGPGLGSSTGWTKPTLSSGEHRGSVTGDARPQVFSEKAVILKGEDFPSLLATSALSSKQKQRQICENFDVWEDKADLSSALDMRPQLRSSALIKSNAHGIKGGSGRAPFSTGQSRKDDATFPAALPLVRLRPAFDWDDDERDRSHSFSAFDDRDGQLLLEGEPRSSLSRDSARDDIHGNREFTNSKKADRVAAGSWRVAGQPSRDLSLPRLLHADRDLVGPRNSSVNKGTGKENSHSRSFGDRRDFSSVIGLGNVEVAEASSERAEFLNNWQRGKHSSSGLISKGHATSGAKSFLPNGPVSNFSKERLISNVGKSFAIDANSDGKGPFSSDATLDLNTKVYRKKKEAAVNPSDFFDPVRESFEAELERVQQQQELERQRAVEEQARAMQAARRESEERERRAKEEEERRRLLEEEAREAAWRAEQEKLEAARRTEEQRIAIKEEKKSILIEEERRKEAARQLLLELEARIAKRQNEANTMDDRVKERVLSRDSDLAEWEKTKRTVENFTSTPSGLSFVNRMSDAGFRTQASNVENYSFSQKGMPESNLNQISSSTYKFPDQDGSYSSSRHDAFGSKRGLHWKQFQGTDEPLPIAPSFNKGMSAYQTESLQRWDRNGDCDQFNGSSNTDAASGAWNHGHFDGTQLAPFSHRSFQNAEVDLISFNRVRHNLRQPRVPPPLSLLPSQCKSSFEATSDGPNASLLVNSGTLTNSASRKEESDLQIVYNCRYPQIGTESLSNELLEGTSSSLLQTEDKNSPRYDSQSSLSVSIPPSSPTQHSHDELDDCGGFSALTTSVEEENMTFSDSKHMIPETDSRHMDSEITFLSHEEDDEWAVDNDDEVQDGDHEVHDIYQKDNEVHDIYQENNEIHEGNLRNLRLANKLKSVDAVVEQSDEELRHSSYGTNVCVQLSCHDVLNKDFGYAEKMNINQGSTTNAMVELVHTTNSEDDLQSNDMFSDEVINTSYDEKMDKRQEDPIFGPIANVSHPLDGIGASEHSDKNPMESASSLSMSSSLCSVSASVPTNLDEVPVRLQFGLFSSPPLIPSPLPTIQIGSIQMPLPLHEQIDSYGQIHSALPPLFQLGQINQYAPLISQSAVPITGHTMSFIHPTALGHNYPDQNTGSSSSNLVSQDSSQPSFAENIVYTSAENSGPERFATSLDVSRDEVLKSQSQITAAASDEKNDAQILISHSANHGVAPNKNFRFMVNPRRTRVRQRAENEPLSAIGKSEVVSKAPGTIPVVRGNRFAYNSRNNGSLPSLRRSENLFANSHRHQRRGRRHFQVAEYRIKEDGGTRQMQQCFEYFSQGRPNEKPYYNNVAAEVSSRNSNRKDPIISKSLKRTDEVALGIQTVDTDSYLSRANKKETMLKKSTTAAGDFCGGVGSLKKNGVMDDDIDTHLRNGIVRIFNQPGIEASTDGDGFVEVRSKRKMSNERRGQRQKETNPKYKTVKVPRRNCSTNLNNVITSRSDMVADSAGGTVAKCTDPAVIKRSQAVQDASLLPTTGIESRMILPVDTATVNFTDANANPKTLKSTQAGSDSDKTSDGTMLIPSLFFGDTIIAHDKTSVPLGTWGTVHLNNQMITSTISQIDEASDPVANNQLAVDKNSLDDSKRVVTHEKLLFSSSNQLNFPFTGEKIQFGAVAMPTSLPSSSQSVSSSIWPSGSVILNASIIHNIVPVNKHSQSSFFDKDKGSGESCTDLDGTKAEAEAEAEAEAAASAVAVAAISNDELSVSTLVTNSTSDNGTKGTSAPGRSAKEQSLVVTLPADLSVDIPQSLWPHLPSTQSSRPMLSHIAGPQPSPFPFFDPNPILGGPIFAFRPQDESSGLQAQPQQTTTFSSVPPGTWSQCHSSVDSFYGSPAGFPAPFMSPPGGLSGVHGHPQMVFYNHFAPVGQFGHQVGLSYMGTTYIPTGKQPDWKHNSKAPAVNVNKADHPCNLNLVYGQQKVARASHLSSETAVNPAASPFPMFNHRPFKSSTTEASSVPAHWPPIPHSSPHSIRLSPVPGHPPSLPPKLSAPNAEPRSAVVADLPDELALLDPTASNSRTVQFSKNPSSIISTSPNAIPSENMMTQHTTLPFQPQPLHAAIGKADQPKASTPKTSSAGEWRRRSSFPRKLRNIGVTRMKQIYVPKSVSAGHAASS